MNKVGTNFSECFASGNSFMRQILGGVWPSYHKLIFAVKQVP